MRARVVCLFVRSFFRSFLTSCACLRGRRFFIPEEPLDDTTVSASRTLTHAGQVREAS